MTEGASPTPVELQVLGGPRVVRDGAEVEALRSPNKRLALLCYLALSGTSHRRERLTGLFWPELDPSRARAALRQSVYYLRREIGDGILTGRGDEEVGFRPGTVVTDAEAFEAAIERGDLEAALDLYRGELLAGLDLSDAGRAWDEWLTRERTRYRERAATAALSLTEEALGRGQPFRAREWAERALEIAPEEPRARDLAALAGEVTREARDRPRQRGARVLLVAAASTVLLALVGWGAWTRLTDPVGAEVIASPPFVEPQIGGLHDLRIAFDSTRDGDNEIYAINADGTELLRLTYDPARDVGPRWSPDGRSIVFTSDRDGDSEVYVMDALGANLRRLTNDPAEDVDPRFSPDGSRIAWASGRAGSLDIHVMGVDGSNVRRVTDHPGDEKAPAFSPDGRRIVFEAQIDSRGDPRAVDLYVVDLEGDGEPRRLNDALTYDAEPDWSPDGSRIAFSSAREDEWNREIRVMNADGSGERNLTRAAGMDWSPRWSPDGSKILFRSDRAGAPDLYVMDADGSNLRRVTRRGARRADWRGPLPRDPGCLVVNGSFEEVEEERSVPDDDRFYGVPGWAPNDALYVPGGYHNSPDIFVPPEYVPRSLFGYQLPAHGRNYAGVAHGWSGGGGKAEGATEALGGALREPLQPGRAYRLRAWFSSSETYADYNFIEIALYSRRTRAVLTADTARVDNAVAWIPYEGDIRVAPDDTNAYDEIVFRGANPIRTPSRGYFFLDDVDVCPVD